MSRFFFLLVLAALTACSEPGPPPPAPAPDNRPVVSLLSLEASAGEAAYPALAFDGDTTTHWITTAGAGHHLRLAFLEPGHPLRAVTLAGIAPDTVAAVTVLRVYADGRPLGRLQPGGSLQFSTAPRRLTFFLEETNGEEEETRSLEDNVLLTLHHAPAGRRVSLGDLRFFDEAGTEYRLLLPHRVTGRVMPSSNLMPLEQYHAGLLFDGLPSRAWVEGGEGPGIGERLQIDLDEEVRITQLLIWSGNQQSEESFRAHPRPRAFAFGAVDSAQATFLLADTMAVQSVPLTPWLEGRHFVLEIRDVFPGQSYRDLALGELGILEGEQALAIHHQWDALVREEIRAGVAQTPLADWLDRRIFNILAAADGDFYRRQSLLLHSNGTFSGYTEDWSAVENKTFETSLEGTWQLLDAGADQMTLRFQGEKTNLTMLATDPGMATQPFSDRIHWSDGQVRGERYLDIYYLY